MEANNVEKNFTNASMDKDENNQCNSGNKPRLKKHSSKKKATEQAKSGQPESEVEQDKTVHETTSKQLEHLKVKNSKGRVITKQAKQSKNCSSKHELTNSSVFEKCFSVSKCQSWFVQICLFGLSYDFQLLGWP